MSTWNEISANGPAKPLLDWKTALELDRLKEILVDMEVHKKMISIFDRIKGKPNQKKASDTSPDLTDNKGSNQGKPNEDIELKRDVLNWRTGTHVDFSYKAQSVEYIICESITDEHYEKKKDMICYRLKNMDATGLVVTFDAAVNMEIMSRARKLVTITGLLAMGVWQFNKNKRHQN